MVEETESTLCRSTHPALRTSRQRRRSAAAPPTLPAPSGDVPQGVADLGQRRQIMVRLHERLKAHLFGLAYGAEDQFLEIQALCLGDE
jgi:hypothetical protein